MVSTIQGTLVPKLDNDPFLIPRVRNEPDCVLKLTSPAIKRTLDVVFNYKLFNCNNNS